MLLVTPLALSPSLKVDFATYTTSTSSFAGVNMPLSAGKWFISAFWTFQCPSTGTVRGYGGLGILKNGGMDLFAINHNNAANDWINVALSGIIEVADGDTITSRLYRSPDTVLQSTDVTRRRITAIKIG